VIKHEAYPYFTLGYAADGYGRVNGISAIATTFGVGELSAANAIAGAFSEYVPVIHVVGYPSTASQANGAILHHTLGNGDFTVFKQISQQITCANVMLNDLYEVPSQIDRAITECYIKSRPVYIALPRDIATKKVEGSKLKTKLNLEFPPNDEAQENYVVDVVLKYLREAKSPVVLVDACTIRHRALKEVHEFVKTSGLPTFVAPMGKGAVDETLPNYGGVYAGDGFNEDIRERVETSDLVLSFGSIKSDFNTANFSYRISQLNTIDFHSNYVKVKYSEYPGTRMNGVITKVTQQLGQIHSIIENPRPSKSVPIEETGSQDPTITHSYLWPRLGQWLQPNDVLLTETGTAEFGVWETRFPRAVTAISQVLWGSIGYATGSCQGAALAAKERGFGRTILFTGDGSFQMTAQEISTMLRHELNPIIFVICNDGYTIERYIHGWDATYNDVQEWRYKEIPYALGAKDSQVQTYVVKTRSELEKLFNDKEFSSGENKKLRFVELYMKKEDAPRALKKLEAQAGEGSNTG